MEFVLPVLTFLLGCVSTSGAYAWVFSNRLTKLETRLDMLDKKVDGIRVDNPPCEFHISLEKKHIELKGRVDAHLESR